MELTSAWIKARDIIREQIGQPAYEAWISKLKAKESEGDGITLCVPDDFFKSWLIKNYSAIIEASLQRVCGKKITIDFDIDPAGLNDTRTKETFTQEEKKPLLFNLNPRFTFDNFVVGPGNRFAHAASLAVSDAPAKAYNPLFIYGGVGLGKTHLMQAICQMIVQKTKGSAKICYLSSEKFTNELIDAIQHHSTSRFRQKYRNADVLVVDDVHFIAGKEATQEEFFHTFNTLYDAHKQIIISSDRNPKDIPNMEERLVSRFSWGLVTDIQPPDFETRVAILKKKIEHEPIKVSDEIIFYMAEIIKTNIRELEGALIRVVAYSLLEAKPISLELVKNVLKDFFKETSKTVTVDLIQNRVGEYFNVASDDIRENKRNKQIVLARQVAMYLARELTTLSLPEIGLAFGGKDHTTVMHSCAKVKALLGKDVDLKNRVGKIIQVIKQ